MQFAQLYPLFFFMGSIFYKDLKNKNKMSIHTLYESESSQL